MQNLVSSIDQEGSISLLAVSLSAVLVNSETALNMREIVAVSMDSEKSCLYQTENPDQALFDLIGDAVVIRLMRHNLLLCEQVYGIEPVRQQGEHNGLERPFVSENVFLNCCQFGNSCACQVQLCVQQVALEGNALSSSLHFNE